MKGRSRVPHLPSERRISEGFRIAHHGSHKHHFASHVPFIAEGAALQLEPVLQ